MLSSRVLGTAAHSFLQKVNLSAKICSLGPGLTQASNRPLGQDGFRCFRDDQLIFGETAVAVKLNAR